MICPICKKTPINKDQEGYLILSKMEYSEPNLEEKNRLSLVLLFGEKCPFCDQ